MITSKVDGYNLVAAETLVSHMITGRGTLLLSARTGCAISLSEEGVEGVADIIPTDANGHVTRVQVKERLRAALTGEIQLAPDRQERSRRYFDMHNLQNWAGANISSIRRAPFTRNFVELHEGAAVAQ
jgi:trehalose-6-phosphate synthase